MKEISYFKSPIGCLEIEVEDDFLTSIKVVKPAEEQGFNLPLSKEVKKQLEQYFKKERKIFSIPCRINTSPFYKKVYEKLIEIPFGKTVSYSQLAQMCDNPCAQRAVGTACAKNPIIIIIPCHRVVKKSADIGNYNYGKSIKEKLLLIEKFFDKI